MHKQWHISYDNDDHGYGQWFEVGPARIHFGWHDKKGAKLAGEHALLVSATPLLLNACKLAMLAFERGANIDWGEVQRAIDVAEGRSGITP